MAFAAIEASADLLPAQRRQVVEAGPPDVLLRTSYHSLLRSAGFVDIVSTDVTSAYRATLEAWSTETERRRDEVVAVMGEDDLAERQSRRAGAMAAVDSGILHRSLYVARRRGTADSPHPREALRRASRHPRSSAK